MTNPKKSRVWFWVIDTSFLCVFLFWMIASSRLLMYGAPWAVSSLWVVSLLLLVPALIFLQQASIERSVGQLAEVVVSIAIAFAVGIIVVGSENHAKPPMDMFKEEPIKAVTVAIVVFAITSIARSSRLLEQSTDVLEQVRQRFETFSRDLEKQKTNLAEQEKLNEQNRNLLASSTAAATKNEAVTDKLMDTTQNAIQTLAEARYAGMAAKALELKQIEIFRRIDGTLDPGITEATEPGLGALGAWIRQGRDIPEDNARQAWWRVMNIYHQEEIYDISSKEIATNVRSYAYTLLAVVSEFLRCLPPDEPNKRLAIANVSGFAPKDFYNFPNGPVGGRFYHEAEFFGIYRRLLAIIAADQRVVPLRVVLADPAEGIRSHTPNSSALDSKRPIGWKLDPIWKLVLDCARIHIVPWPIVGPTVQSKAAEDFYPPERRTQWGVVFPEGRDPAKKLPYSTLRYLWAPTYADVRDLYHDYGPTDTLDQWLRHVAPYETIVESNDDVPQELKDKATRGKESGLETRIDKLRKKDQLSAFCETYLGKNNVDPANLVARLDKAWSAILKEFFYWIDLNPNLTDRIEEVIRLQSFQSIDSELRDRGVTLPSASDDDAGRYLIAVHRAYQLSQSFLQNKIDSRKTDYTDKMLVLAHTCHEIDALGKYLQIEHKRFTPAPEYSSAGVELGPAENWLHRFLIWLEASKLESEIRVNGPLPLWKLMASDLCGVASGQNKDTEKEAEEMLGKLRGRLKICTVGSDSNSTTREMEKEFIFPEFLMVGMTSADNLDADGNVVKLEKIEWCGLVGASISEPYQTCRIQLLFGKDDPRIRAHTGWLNEIWKNGDNDTQTFINKLKKEVANVPPYRQST